MGLVAALLISHQLLLQPVLVRLGSDAPVINVAGRQRMLSQKLAKSALGLQMAETVTEKKRRQEELAAVVTEWSRAHRGLQQGDRELRLPGHNSPEVQARFSQLEPDFQAILAAAQNLLAEDAGDLKHSPTQRAAILTIMEHENAFLTQMHSLVGLFTEIARTHVGQLQALGWGIVSAILGLLLAMQWLVIRPAVNLVGTRLASWEEQYRRLVESMSEGLIVHDGQGQILLANYRFCELVGLHRDDVLGQSAVSFVSETDRSRYQSMIAETAPVAAPFELALSHHRRGLIDTMASIQSLPDYRGSANVFLLVVTDMTARKQAEKRSRELLEQLAHANRMKSMGELAAGLAHEINQPLAAIANYTEGCLASLEDASLDSKSLQVPLQRILSAALRGGEIVRRARQFSQRRPHEFRTESLNSLVRDVEQLCRAEALRCGVSIELALAEDLPPLPLDGLQVQQVMANLFQNAFAALESMPATRRQLRIETALMSPEFVRVTVRDTGPGLVNADPARLFEPFYTTRRDGLGLGLAIAQSIVEAHGGVIQAFTNPEGGATFQFTLSTKPQAGVADASQVEEEIAHA